MPPDPGGGGGSARNSDASDYSHPDLRTVTPAWAGDSASGGSTRSFSQIITEEKQKRNILELNITKILSTDENGDQTRPRSLTYEDLGEFLFDILMIDPEDLVALNLNTGRYDQRELKFKPDIDVSPYLRPEPVAFKDHHITVGRQSQNVTRITFKNVPLNVPDEEILHLCRVYGKPLENKVQYEKINIKRGSSVTGGTRFVDMEMAEGRTFLNYYWMEGPLNGDKGKRIVVLHSNQPAQCSHCLRTAADRCPGLGLGKPARRPELSEQR